MAGGGPYVVGIDSSTQSVKAIAWTRAGTPAAEGRVPLAILQPRPDWAEQDADTWWEAACAALRAVTAQIDPQRIEGIAISNQRETMVLCGEDGAPLAPATLWLDSRANPEKAALVEVFGAETLHRISGKPVDVIPCLYRLSWFRRHEAALLERSAKILDVQGFLLWRLTGRPAASWTSADPFGLFDIAEKRWSPPLLDHLAIRRDQLPEALPPATQAGTVTSAAAAASGLRPGTPVFLAGGDGHCAGLGSNAARPGTAYLNLGTAVVGGLWSPTPELSRYWRTLTSPTGEGYFLESCQRGGSFFLNWFIDNFAGGRADPAVFAKLDEKAARLPVGSDGVTVCPYLLGCMDPHWDGAARATFTGLGPDHTAAHLYRAALEAITLEFARGLAAMRATGREAERVVAIGGGAGNPVWVKMVADATGTPVCRGLSDEASALGAGISAAVGAGWFTDFADAADTMTKVAGRTEPDTAAASAWAELSVRQARVYLDNAGTARD